MIDLESMGKNLVIVESPAKAKTIQKFLGDDFVVKSSFGHIRDLHSNTLSVDVENGFKPEYVVPEDKKKVVAELSAAAQKADTIWLASDEDREGEAIAWHLKETLGLDDSNTRRIAFHEITKNAILSAIDNPREVDMNLVNAQQARRVLDRLVGFELSPILWKRIQPKLSAGRVQSVALRLVVDREREAEAFRPEAFYKTEGRFTIPGENGSSPIKATFSRKFSDASQAEQFIEAAKDAAWNVSDIETKAGKRTPAAPFTTSTLQQEAARRLRFSVKQTMTIAQKLYEEGLITYMRTDSTNLSSLAINTAKEYIKDHFGEKYSKTRQYKTRSKGAQEAHEAIRPTYIDRDDIEGTPTEKRLYRLIWERTVASQMADADIEKTDITISSGSIDGCFAVQASRIIFDGFLKLHMDTRDEEAADSGEEQVIPELRKGQALSLEGIRSEMKFTSAPSRYSEATLVKRLEELGIGRPSTYAPTISTLTTERGYIYKGDIQGKPVSTTDIIYENGEISRISGTTYVGAEKGRLIPHNVGMVVTDYLVKGFERIMDYGFTADVEKDFDKIAEGELVWVSVISDFYSTFHEKVKDSPMPDPVARELGTDATGAKVYAKFGKYGAYAEKVKENGESEFASLADGQLIESITLEEALKLFEFPRKLGQSENGEVAIHKGPYGPYIKCGTTNVPLPKGADPMKITLEEALEAVAEKLKKNTEPIFAVPEEDITVLDGKYGPYIKHKGNNYKIPKDTDIHHLTAEICREIVSKTPHTRKKGAKR